VHRSSPFPSTLAKGTTPPTIEPLLRFSPDERPVAPALWELPSIRDVIDGLILK
jgi:hypothetical protein